MRRSGARRIAALAIGLCIGAGQLTGCAAGREPDSPPPVDAPGKAIAYETEIEGSLADTLAELLRASMRLFTLAGHRPASLARLRQRAEHDIEVAREVLRSEGYYEGTAAYRIDRADAASTPPPAAPSSSTPDKPAAPGSAQAGPAPDAAPVRVIVAVDPGARFTLSRMHLALKPAAADPAVQEQLQAAVGLAPGSPARAPDIVEAESRAVTWLDDHGYPYARFDDRRVVADLAANTLAVDSRIDPGPRVRFGELRFEGVESVDRDYLATYRPWREGGWFAGSQTARMQAALFATGLFDSVSVEPPPRSGVDPTVAEPRVPITVRAIEADHRTVGGGLRFSTDEGPEANGFLEHRNLLGANETGRASLRVGLSRQELSLGLRKPQFLRGGQSLYSRVQGLAEDADAFRERTGRVELGLERRVNRRLTVSAGLAGEVARITDDGVTEDARLIGSPLAARYDASDDALDPKRGFRASGTLTPYTGTYAGASLLFSSFDLGASAYLPLGRSGRHLVALRGRLGSLVGAGRDAVPQNKRLYSGGGGSVRGYKARFIGPLDAAGDPLGGRSVAELSTELRVRFSDTIGAVAFLDAGTVSQALLPDFDRGVQLGAGLGLRYYTIVGPIRADLAIPLNPRDADAAFQFYLSIGQAF